MCGIIGYCGNSNAVPVLVDGLHALEYRGYDSAGISVFTGKGREKCVTTVKVKGRISELEKRIASRSAEIASNCGIGHTRWATHGEPSDVNSHPHSAQNVVLVHNGIIENYVELKNELSEMGYAFESETDTEVAAKLLDLCYLKLDNKIEAIEAAVSRLKGSYALGIIFKDEAETIYAIRKDSPLIVAKSDDGCFIASDIPAILKHTRDFYSLEHNEIAVLKRESLRFFSTDGTPVSKEIQHITWDIDAAEKGGYEHFMLKEIFEEPEALKKTVGSRLKDGLPEFDISAFAPGNIKRIGRIHIVACGTAMHAGLIGKYAIEKLARIPVSVEIASEFRYNNPILSKGDLFIAVSQSGETADTLAALRLAKSRGLHTVGIVNVVGSGVAREADSVIYTWAGPEIAVASTKAYVVQIAVMYMLAVKMALSVGQLDENTAKALMRELHMQAPVAIEGVLSSEKHIKATARGLMRASDLFFIGRGIDGYLASEASLKLKEVSYIHSEAYAAGELKHGTISLITDGVPVVAIATDKAVFEKTVSNVKECKARGAKVLLVCTRGMSADDSVAESVIELPELSELFMALPACCAVQLLAYYAAVARGCDVDKPRNLAKSVTVE